MISRLSTRTCRGFHRFSPSQIRRSSLSLCCCSMRTEAQYKAIMILSAVGDTLGFKNGDWEFCNSGPFIHKELQKLGGLEKLNVKGWLVSDDTVLHIAIAEALLSDWSTKEDLYDNIAAKLKVAAQSDMSGRSPGATTMNACSVLKPGSPQGHVIPFNPTGGGCGAAMRSMCIGMVFYTPEQVDDLIAVSVESGRMTHNHPTGYLGSVVSALFLSYAIQEKPTREWGASLLVVLPRVWQYVEQSGRDVTENKKAWSYFTNKWTSYLKLRGILNGDSEPGFPAQYGMKERDAFYESLSYSGWGGASGHDAPMIAYDALLGAGSSWSELCSRGMFHSGDSDSTGVIAAAWWGAIYGMETVPKCNFEELEYRKRLEKLGKGLYDKTIA